MSASSCAAVVLPGAIPSRAEAGIAIASADTTIAAAISKIRLMFVFLRVAELRHDHKLPETDSFPSRAT
jgi:hypothetical protein